ncbi:MAG: DUF2849 domain-containing protein [Hyphomonas sp.]|uniref:DUF2849 domain-containing protein n=1 Tax=Hyphomonas sp. TaxID=87 RepID=UPI0034A0989C
MTSVRAKLKPETPKSVTGWFTATGRSAWMCANGSWTEYASNLGVFIGDEAEARLAAALKEEGLITDPYFMEVSVAGEITGRETLRESLRADMSLIYGGAA